MPVAVQFYDVVVWLHVSAVVVGFGPTFAFGVYLAVVGKTDPRSIPAVLRAQSVVVRTMVTTGMVIILASGIYLVADSAAWDFSTFFVVAGLVSIIVLFGLAHGFFEPNDRRAREIAERDIEAAGPGEVQFSEEFNARSGRSATVGALAGLLVILTIYVMAAKPFL